MRNGSTLNKKNISRLIPHHKSMCPGTIMQIPNPPWWLAPFYPVVHAGFQISDKEFAIISMKDISVQPELKYNQIQTLKIKLTPANSWRRPRIVLGHARRLPGRLALDLVLCWSPQLVFFCAGLYFFSFCFSRRFSFNFTHYWYIAAITIWRCSTATAKISANSMGYFCCGRSRCPNLVFHWSAAWPSWHPLWWGVISFQNFMSLKLGLYFCVNFPSSSELIGYVDLTYSYEIWPKCSLVINAQKGVRLFWYSKYFSFYALSIGEDPQIFNSPSSK